MMKFYLFLHNFSEFEIYFLDFPWKIVFGVISGKYLYKTAIYLKLFWFKLFAHSKLKLLDFLWDFVLYYYRRPNTNFPVLEAFVCSRQILFLLILNRSPEQQHEPVLQLYVNI